MKKQINSGLVSICLPVLFLAGCTSTPKSPNLTDTELEVTPSFLKADYKPQELELPAQEANNKGEKQTFSSKKVPSMAGLLTMQREALVVPQFDDKLVTIVADQMPAKQFADKVFSEVLSLNYVVDPSLAASKSRFTINMSKPVLKSELYRTAVDTMLQNGVAVYRKGDILYLQQQGKTDRKNDIPIGIGASAEDIPDAPGQITQLVPYTYSEGKNIVNILTKLSSATVTVLGNQKLMVLEGTKAELERAIRIVNMLDVPRAYGRHIRMFEFVNVRPEDAIKQIRELLEEDGYQVGSSGDIAFVSMPRINSMVAYAASEAVIRRINYWASEIDIPKSGDEKQYYVFKPSYAKAEEMYQTLSRLLRGAEKTDKPDEPNIANIRFSVDKHQNAIIFQATPAEYRQLNSLLKQIDILPGQVILDVNILEVTLKDDVSSGIDWAFNSKGAGNASSSSGSIANLSSSGVLSAVVLDGNWRANISLNDQQDDIRILSRPYMIVRDGQSATINSGDQIPIITQVTEGTSSINDGQVTNQVQYRSTGVNVSLTPTINSDGVISLEVSMSVSRQGASQNIGVQTPTITNRSISTKIISRDGQTVALGGLIQNSVTDIENGVPILSEIPILGQLFKSKSDSNSRSELIMLITTRIVRDSMQVDEFGRKISELYSAPVTIN